MSALTALLGALVGFTIYYLTAWFSGVKRARTAPEAPPEAKEGGLPTPAQFGLGFITNFFDTLGIGSFAPTTAAFKFFRMVPDRLIPGTLNVGHTLGAVVQTFIYTLVIDVDITTLTLMILAAVLGARLGAGVVASWPKRKVQIGMGTALLVAAALFTRAQIANPSQPVVAGAAQTGAAISTTGWDPSSTVLRSGSVFTIDNVRTLNARTGRGAGLVQFTALEDVVSDAEGKATLRLSTPITVDGPARTVFETPEDGASVDVGTLSLAGVKLALGLLGNFALGALMTLGIGLYAPCMILVGLLGMNARTAFPIMMGSCAFLMPLASATFVRKHAYALRPALGLALGSVPAVLIAAYLVTSMPLYYVRWLVVGVVIIAATMMLRSAAKNE
jgi:uncharacterized membrane protein YfcA